MKQKKEEIPILHKAVASRFLEYADEDLIIPYSKVKFVLRCGFRITGARVCDLVEEFCKYGILKRLSLQRISVSEEFKVQIDKAWIL